LDQIDEFARYEEKRTQRKILREFAPRGTSASQLSEIIEVLQRVEARKPGSILIRTGCSKRIVMTLPEDFFAAVDR
jgi:hypothetical protein